MANYDREKMEKQGNASVGLGAGLLTTVLAGAAILYQEGQKGQKRQEIDAKISKINQQINELNSRFLGSVFHADEISELKQKKKRLENERKNLG